MVVLLDDPGEFWIVPSNAFCWVGLCGQCGLGCWDGAMCCLLCLGVV